MILAQEIIQCLAILLIAPLLDSLLARTFAWRSWRRGGSLWQEHQSLMLLVRQKDRSVFWPLCGLVAMIAALGMIPIARQSALLGFFGDTLLFVLLFFLSTVALSLGCASGTRAALATSRQLVQSGLSLLPMLLSLLAFELQKDTLVLSAMQSSTSKTGSASLGLAAIALLCQAYQELSPKRSAAYPEEELGYQGRPLAIARYTNSLRRSLWASLVLLVFLPLQQAENPDFLSFFSTLGIFLLALMGASVARGLVETTLAPKPSVLLTLVATSLSFLAASTIAMPTAFALASEAVLQPWLEAFLLASLVWFSIQTTTKRATQLFSLISILLSLWFLDAYLSQSRWTLLLLVCLALVKAFVLPYALANLPRQQNDERASSTVWLLVVSLLLLVCSWLAARMAPTYAPNQEDALWLALSTLFVGLWMMARPQKEKLRLLGFFCLESSLFVWSVLSQAQLPVWVVFLDILLLLVVLPDTHATAKEVE